MKRSKGSRLALGEPWASDLADFCEAAWGAPEVRIVRAALEAFIRERLAAEPDLRKRFEDARRKRLGATDEKIRVITPK
jgi:hypothetical protein